ncbi:hypothetical protein RHMOL_Rhmol04G0303100 [Rhododendron molle]|uniref:Uncharacterized protein n=1 Tax=Rhododendron molle TaxID=49168 RepID=A0ACC0P765_RHOML|nr:hypothetical protein RHMOL_Rhmol04G0303100 [Rhododendron molle]
MECSNIQTDWGALGLFYSVDEETFKELSFVKGMVLIATKESQKIDRRITMVVQGVEYDVRITEKASFVNPDEVENCIPAGIATCGVFWQPKKSPVSSGVEPQTSGRKVGDDEVEPFADTTTNRKSDATHPDGLNPDFTDRCDWSRLGFCVV